MAEDTGAAESQRGLNEQDTYGCEIACGKYRSKRRQVPCMKFLNNAKGVLVLLCFALFMEGLVNAGLFNAVISTIEKRFQIQSTESGVVASGFDVFACIALLVVAFYGDSAFKPLWIGWGTFIMGVGCVLYALPHFFVPTYHPSNLQNDTLCGANATDSVCSGGTIRNYRHLFYIANGLIGLGSTPLFTIAITYIDENVKQKNSALYGGLYYSMGAIGPAAGYLLGSALLNTYTYLGSKDNVAIDSAFWIGNWWIGFLAVGVFCIVISFFIDMFPRSLPNTARFRDNRNNEVHTNAASTKATTSTEFGKSWRDAPKVIWLLLTNLPYVSLTLSSCINYSFVYGFNTFGAKYITSVFGVSVSMASLAFGVTVILAASVGQFLGGWIITKFQLTVEGILKFMIWCTVVAMLASVGFLMHCKNADFVGPTHSSENIPIMPSCSGNCGCNTDTFDPVCGSDERTYFSSCFAGCGTRVNKTHYADCNCVSSSTIYVAGGGNASELSAFPTTAFIGECTSKDCNWFGPFLATIFVSTLFTLMKTTPNLQATIRCIPFSLRTTAISLQRLVFTLLGTIPGRIITGRIIDFACISWSTECGYLGACRAYDTALASRYMTYLICSQMVICLILQIITLALYHPPKTAEQGTPDPAQV